MEPNLRTDGRRLLGALSGRKHSNTANGEPHIARKIEQSISYMLQNLNQPLQVATLAAAVNVSPSHYSALFKQWMGSSPIDYFIHLRMQQACRLFESTSMNVKEVAAALGYEDPFYFSRTFKAIHRVAPSAYRMMPKRQKDMVGNEDSVSAAPGPWINGKLRAEDNATAGSRLKAPGGEKRINLHRGRH